MKIDLSKVKEVLITDENKNCIDRFFLDSASFQRPSNILTLQKHPIVITQTTNNTNTKKK